MKKLTIIGSLATAAMLLGSVSAFAQPGPDGDHQGAPALGGREGGFQERLQHPVTVKHGSDSVYTLDGRTLTRRDGKTLKKIASVTLGEDKGRQPQARRGQDDRAPRDGKDGRNERQVGGRDGQPGERPMFPPMPAQLLVVGEGRRASVLVITPHTFYRLNAQTLAVIVKTELPRPEMGRPGQGRPAGQMPGMHPNREQQADRVAPQAGGERPQGMAGGPPQGVPHGDKGGPNMQGDREGRGPEQMMAGGPQGCGFMPMRDPEVRGNTLYLQRGPRLLAIDYRTGKVTATTNISAHPQQGGAKGEHAR